MNDGSFPIALASSLASPRFEFSNFVNSLERSALNLSGSIFIFLLTLWVYSLKTILNGDIQLFSTIKGKQMSKYSHYHFSYAISKQLPTAHSLNSSYGKLELEKGIPELSPEPDPNPSPVDKVLAFYKSALLEKNTNALKNM